MSLCRVQKCSFIKIELIQVAMVYSFKCIRQTDKQVLKLQAEVCFMLLFVSIRKAPLAMHSSRIIPGWSLLFMSCLRPCDLLVHGIASPHQQITH